MKEFQHCQRCGVRYLEASPLAEHCVACLLELGLSGADADSKTSQESFFVDTSGAILMRAQGAQFGGYRIGRLIGEGGMGAVYEAEQERTCRIVALKVLKPGLATPAMLRRFEQETQALGRLQHSGIAQIY